ncbi:MAG TPA: Sec-independent protein translocase protein TatB [Bradyrhizobium sp.]|nr:Sec-independent protein translocase protein TatB [Bradyrhizobium sp.]
MFDISWSEFAIIAVVALIAIGPKELPGVLRMVGQWMGKARKMAAEFQSQFQEAMREAEMADLKKSFDEVKEAATGFTSDNVLTSLQKDVNAALNIEDVDKPAANAAQTSTAAEVSADASVEATSQPPAIAAENQEQAVPPTTAPAEADTELQKDAKAS